MDIPEIAHLVRFYHESERGWRGRGREALRPDINVDGPRERGHQGGDIDSE